MLFLFLEAAGSIAIKVAFSGIFMSFSVINKRKELFFMRVTVSRAKTTIIMEEFRSGFTELWIYAGDDIH
jgi:hypothetical protein